ncbi:hypothetical protein F4604DRAFT_1932027 [Suillus subluteus]|nr:hypothetical protein F4604DRAFT_1932027 [Suillus subluteus]
MFQQHLGMQYRSDGAGVSAEKPINTLQGAQNMNSHPGPLSLSTLGLYGEEGGVFDFGGQQPQPSDPGLNQMRAHQFDQPHSTGYNPHPTPYSDPGSYGHSIPPATPMMDEHPGLRGYSVPPTPQFHSTMHRNDSSMAQNNFQQKPLTEMQKIYTCLTVIESASQIILATQQHNNMLKELIESIDAMMVSGTSKGTTGKKNISNKHPALKPIIHPIFFKLCGIDVNAVHGEQVELLAKMPPLESGDPYEMTVDGVKVWRPQWAV